MQQEKFAEQVQELKQSLIEEGAKNYYIGLLKNFDWQFEFSDDNRVYQKGRDSLQDLYELQEKIDPDGEIWMQHRPDSHGAPFPNRRKA